MAIYLKKFETQAAYEAAQSGLILPNVSLTVDNNTVHYNPSTPPAPSHDYVEIGGVKWATMNIGANSITDTGLYFQWGDTQGYTAAQIGTDKNFTESDYKYYDNGAYTKYNETDGLTALTSSDDAVTAAWGGNWRMPTVTEFEELEAASLFEYTNDYQGSGVAGLVCTDENDSSKTLFFPAAGYVDNGYLDTYNCYYWMRLLDTYDVQSSHMFYVYIDDYSADVNATMYRFKGSVVRGVLDE